MQDIRKFHQLFYKVHTRSVQNDFILKYVIVGTPCWHHNRKGKFEREVSIPTHRNGITSQTQVCQKMFLSSLCLKKDRVQLLCKRFLLNDDKDDEKKRKDRWSQTFANKKEVVRHFIESISSVESHYNRFKNSTRQYLRNDFSIKKTSSDVLGKTTA